MLTWQGKRLRLKASESNNGGFMGSYFHSMVQVNLAHLLKLLGKYQVFSELSLEIDKSEYKPDVCLYPKEKKKKSKDITRMTELPLLAIEILSPSQGFQELVVALSIIVVLC